MMESGESLELPLFGGKGLEVKTQCSHQFKSFETTSNDKIIGCFFPSGKNRVAMLVAQLYIPDRER